MAEQVVYIENEAARTRHCTELGKALDCFSKQLYETTEANVAVFAGSNLGRVNYGLVEVMDLLSYAHTMEFDLLGKLASDIFPLELELELGARSAMELEGLENRLVTVMYANDAVLENLTLCVNK